MDKRGFANIILIVIVAALLGVGGLWYYKMHQEVTISLPINEQSVVSTTNILPSGQSTSSPQEFSFSCTQNGTTTMLVFEDLAEGFAFCYPSNLTVSTDTNNMNAGTHDITWPNAYTDPVSRSTVPYLSFIVIRSNSSSILAALPQCDLSGSRGDYNCNPPNQSQIIKGTSTGYLSFALFRTDFILNDTSNVINSSTGPYAFVELNSSTYLIFQATVGASLPSYVDGDLKEILSTVNSTDPTTGLTSAKATSTSNGSKTPSSSPYLFAWQEGKVSFDITKVMIEPGYRAECVMVPGAQGSGCPGQLEIIHLYVKVTNNSDASYSTSSLPLYLKLDDSEIATGYLIPAAMTTFTDNITMLKPGETENIKMDFQSNHLMSNVFSTGGPSKEFFLITKGMIEKTNCTFPLNSNNFSACTGSIK